MIAVIPVIDFASLPNHSENKNRAVTGRLGRSQESGDRCSSTDESLTDASLTDKSLSQLVSMKGNDMGRKTRGPERRETVAITLEPSTIRRLKATKLEWRGEKISTFSGKTEHLLNWALDALVARAAAEPAVAPPASTEERSGTEYEPTYAEPVVRKPEVVYFVPRANLAERD